MLLPTIRMLSDAIWDDADRFDGYSISEIDESIVADVNSHMANNVQLAMTQIPPDTIIVCGSSRVPTLAPVTL